MKAAVSKGHSLAAETSESICCGGSQARDVLREGLQTLLDCGNPKVLNAPKPGDQRHRSVTPAAAEVWKAFGDRVRRYIRKSIRNDSDADDVLQDVFVRVHKGAATLKRRDKLESWIFKVTRFAIVDHFRRRKGMPVPLDVTREPAEPPRDEDVSSLVASWLKPLMEELSPEDREALKLTDLEGMSQKDLATTLNLSATGARSRVQRARARLKEVLLQCCQVEMDRRGNAISYSRRRAHRGDGPKRP